MILLLHIGIAVFSLFFAAYGFVVPSKLKVKISYGLLGLTLVSGTYLVVMAPAHMASACMAGLFYTGVMIAATVLTRRKLAHISSQVAER